MAHFTINKKWIRNLRLPKEYDPDKIQIGIPVTGDEASRIGLFNIGDVVLPSAKYGVNCMRNAYGYTYPDKKQPKKKRYVSTNWIQPFGNIYASSIAVDIYKPCYLKIEVPPTEIELILIENDSKNKFVIANLTSEIRKQNLKEAINIFLEIYGFCHVFSDEIKINHSMKRHRCNWRMLPPGEKPSVHLRKYLKDQNKKDDTFDAARLDFIEKYKMDEIVEGINGFNGYYAYVFTNYCVLESAIYGNATYIIPSKNWEVLSQKTKQELIDEKMVVEKIVHTANWEDTVRRSFERLKIGK